MFKMSRAMRLPRRLGTSNDYKHVKLFCDMFYQALLQTTRRGRVVSEQPFHAIRKITRTSYVISARGGSRIFERGPQLTQVTSSDQGVTDFTAQLLNDRFLDTHANNWNLLTGDDRVALKHLPSALVVGTCFSIAMYRLGAFSERGDPCGPRWIRARCVWDRHKK